MTIHDYEIKAGVFTALLAAGAEVTIEQSDVGFIATVNGRRPQWEIRSQRQLGRRSVTHINVGHGAIGRGLRLIRPKAGVFDFTVIAQALIENVDKRRLAEQARKATAHQEAAAQSKEDSNAEAAARIVAENGGAPTAYRTTHCKLTAHSWGITVETTTESENEARYVVAAIERTLHELRAAAAAAAKTGTT